MQENKNRSFKIIEVIALCVAVIGLAVAYAALSQNLEIKGTATVEKTTWSIVMKNPNTTTGTKGGVMEVTDSNISAGTTTISGLKATLTKPGDVAQLTLDVVNVGDIDAVLKSISTNGGRVNCDDDSNIIEEDKKIVCGDSTTDPGVKVTVSYDDKDVTTSDLAVKDSDLQHGDAYAKKLIIKVEYSADVDAVPSQSVKVNLPDITLLYEQKMDE